jgi:hypothetical protein
MRAAGFPGNAVSRGSRPDHAKRGGEEQVKIAGFSLKGRCRDAGTTIASQGDNDFTCDGERQETEKLALNACFY